MTSVQPHISVVMTCFNRREKTLACLRSLLTQQDLEATLAVFLVDDGSHDGTSAAIASEFPQVSILRGNGSLYWGGGMFLAMSEAVKHSFDYILWLNDDVALHTSALAALLEAQADAKSASETPAIIVGAVTDPTTGLVSYAGFDRKNWFHPAQVVPVQPAPGKLVPCDAMNGNCVLIPRAVIEQIGLIDGKLVHRYGDIDYGYRARQAGFDVLIAPTVVGTCPPNPPSRKKDLSKYTFYERWKILTAPIGMPLRPMFRFMWRHGGVVGAVFATLTGAKVALAAIKP